MIELHNIPASILPTINLLFGEIVIKSTLAIALAAVACRLLNRQSAAVRHRVWVFGLAASLVVPFAALLLPQFTFPVLPGSAETTRRVTNREIKPASLAMSPNSSSPDSAGGPTRGAMPRQDAETKAITSISPDASGSDATSNELTSVSTGMMGIEQLFVVCWLLGTIVSSSLFLISFAKRSIWLRRLRRIDDADWIDAVTNAARTIGVQRTIVALQSDEACVPAVVGAISPRLVIPSNWRTWSPTQRHCILLHELAHVKRCDVSTQLLGSLALLAYWFNPLVWHAVRQLRAERELASDDCVLLSGQAASDYAEQLLSTLRCCRVARPSFAVAMAHSARLDHRVMAILDPDRRRDPVGSRFAVILPCVAGLFCGLLGGVTLTSQVAIANPPAEPNGGTAAKNANPTWKEKYTVEYDGTLPVSVAFSSDGQTLLTGDTGGEIMALIVSYGELRWRWKSNVAGSHATVAFSADQKQIYATTQHGVRVLDTALGKEQARIEETDSNPTAIGVFPNKTITEDVARTQIVFGNPRGYFVESWVEDKLPDTLGTIQTNTVPKDAKPADETAVPLAVDPNGRSAIMTGPIDATGQAGGEKGKNVLWAYVCGDYGEGSPGNRVMPGHNATVVCAAWAKEGGTAVTGDAAGRVIVWDAKTMTESRRLELGGRIAALAISDDGTRTAAWVLGRRGQLYVLETAKPVDAMKPIHTELGDFSIPTSYASLSFSPDGKQLAGCAIDKKWRSNLSRLVGKVRVWELPPELKAQVTPKHLYVRKLPKESSTNFVLIDDHSILMPSDKEGGIEYIKIADGHTQMRILLGKFTIGQIKQSFDRRWLAMEMFQPTKRAGAPAPDETFDVGVFRSSAQQATIPLCSQLLDITSGGKIVAVVRENQIQLWDVANMNKLKAAPFKHTRIDAASFSPDGQLLAISDKNELVLWRWDENTHERIELGRRVGSLKFSPDARFLAEGPTPGESIQIRDLETRKVVQTLSNSTKQPMNVPRMAFTPGARELIACDNAKVTNPVAGSQRINIWNTADGSLAQQLTVPTGLPQNLDVTQNGRYLVAMLVDGEGVKLSTWQLDDEILDAGPMPPAAAVP